MMKVKFILPHKILAVHSDVSKVKAEGLEGHFTLLPAHIDYIAVLVPGIMELTVAAKEHIFAVDHGTLVKFGHSVHISCRNGVEGDDIGRLSRLVEEKYKEIDEMEKKGRNALLGLEYGIVRGFNKLGQE